MIAVIVCSVFLKSAANPGDAEKAYLLERVIGFFDVLQDNIQLDGPFSTDNGFYF